MTKTIKIGNAGGYWGDDPGALYRQVNGGRLDYITMDFLAEVTMSIMQKQRARNAKAGYARDFITMLNGVLQKILDEGTTIITNAGGVNPESCAEAIQDLADSVGLRPKIAVVYGDDIMERIPELQNNGCDFKNMETGEDFSTVIDAIESANVYFGAAPVVEALKWEPDIIITGRVTDTGNTVAPMIHEFGWQLDDWNRIAAGIVAGHILECGSQATGGNFSDWHLVKNFDQIGYPIVEFSDDGSFVVTKHSDTGGLVSVDTVREQLFYEMGRPDTYLTPDVVADFTSIHLEQHGKDRVRVSNIKGFEPTPLYKVSMAYRDGYKAIGEIAISGPDARAKAETFAKIFWQRVEDTFAAQETEYFGWNACHRTLGGTIDGNEIILRLGVRDADRDKLRRFGKLIPSLILSGPPGVTVLGGVPRAHDVVSYWPALMPKTTINPKIARYDRGFQDSRTVTTTRSGSFTEDMADCQTAKEPTAACEVRDSGEPLYHICLARSGDKGDTANIGLMARSPEAYNFLEQHITAQLVKNLFQELCHGRVSRYAVKNLLGF